jgi:hypothetical protein
MLVVHKPFDLEGKVYPRGTTLSGPEADKVALHSVFAGHCGQIADPAPAVVLAAPPAKKVAQAD